VFHTEKSQPHKQHIWFLPKLKAQTKKPKELEFFQTLLTRYPN
jgi:hypothetical protein